MSEQLQSYNKNQDQILQIRLGDILLFIRKYFLLIGLVALAFGILGYLVSLTFTKTYKVNTLLLPEYSMGTSSFFSMASRSSEGAENLVPDLYPTVLKSMPFGIYLLKQPVLDQNNKSYPTLEDFLKSPQPSFGFFSSANEKDSKQPVAKAQLPIQLPNKNILSFNSDQDQIIRSAIGLVSSSIDKKNGIITIESEMADPVVASQLVEAGKNYLVTYVEEYRTAKIAQQTEFLKDRVKEAKRRQTNAEYALQSYRDNHRDAFLNVARIEEQRLQADYTLTQSLYADLNLQLEQSIIKMKNEKPVFKVLEPAKIPLFPSGPKKLMNALFCAIFGGVISLFYILLFREKVYRHFL